MAKHSAIDWLGFLNEFSRRINLASQDLKSALKILMDDLIPILGIDGIAIWVVEKETNFMRIEDSYGLSERYVRFFNKTDRIRVGRGLVGKVMSQRKTLYIQDLKEYQEIGIKRWNEMLSEEKISAILAAPMFVAERIVGALNIYYKEPHGFDIYEKLFIETIANQVAVIIENINDYGLIKKHSQDLKNEIDKLLGLQEVTRFLNLHIYQSIDTALESLADYVREKFKARGLAVFQKEEKADALILSGSQDLSEPHIRYLREHPVKPGPGTLVGLAFSEREPKTASRVFTDERIEKEFRVFLSNERIIAAAAFPLLVYEKVIGVLVVYYDHLHNFSDEETGILNTFSQFLGISLENIHNFRSLALEKQKTVSMLYSLDDGIIVYDLAGNIIELNPRAEELLLVRKKDAVGRNPRELLYKSGTGLKNAAEVSLALIDDFASREIVIADALNLVIKVTQLPVRGEPNIKIGSLRVLHDITQEKAVEKLKSSFVSTASHQIRTPLTGIKWSLRELLEEETGLLNKNQKGLLARAFSSIETLISLVNDLLDVSRIEEGRFGYNFEKGDIFELMSAAVRDFEVNIRKGRLNFTLHKPKEELPKVSFDRKKMDVAIKNIIDNAIKYTLPGGGVEVRLDAGKKSLMISINDTGIGIPKEDQKFLFNKFFRAKNAIRLRTEGSGLGLYIAKNIIEKHNGKIIVDSRESKGSSFMIQLPLDPAEMPRGVIKGL